MALANISKDYMRKLDAVSEAPDELFPDLLLSPLFNPYDDRYHHMDLDDSRNKAVDADYRFTRENITSIQPSVKRIDKWLEQVQLYDAYEAYLIDTYGSIEVVKAMIEDDVFDDPFPRRFCRPALRKKSNRALLVAGIIPSFPPEGYDPVAQMEWVKELCDDDRPDISGEDEPDIEWAMNREMTKEELRIIEASMIKYRQSQRLSTLANGTKSTGVWAWQDWVDGYYQNLARGEYDTSFSLGTKSNLDLTAEMAEIHNEQFMSETDRIDRERGFKKNKSGLVWSGSVVTKVDQQWEDEKEFLRYLYSQGLDLSGAMRRAGVSRKAIRHMYEEAGIQTEGMTKKQLKKLDKERRRTEKIMGNISRSDSILAQTLRTNRLLMGNGNFSFEKGFH